MLLAVVRRSTFACLLATLLLAPHAAAQTVTGTIQGTARDASGGVLPGVTITVRNLDTGATRIVVTNDVGFYQAPFLPLGPHSVTAELEGFKTFVRQPVQVTLNNTSVVDVRMEPGGVQETVTVTADAPPINTVNFEIKGSLNAQQIEDRPSASQTNFLSLAETFSGFQENPTTGQNNPTASSGSSINFNGTGTRGATFQINGVNNDDSSENQNRQGVALATIKEFQVISNGFSAEFGRAYGAVVLVQTKSGTNQLRGEGYGFFQDSSLNARSFYATTKPVNERQQYGGTAGFPFVRDTLFGFFSLDRVRDVGDSNYARDFPLPSEINGPRLTRGNDTPENRAFIESVLARFPNVTPNDPRSPRTYATVVSRDWPAEDYTGRVDWNAGGGGTLFARYQYTHQLRRNGEVIIGEQTLQDNTQQNLGVTWTHIFGPATIGELRYGLGWRDTNVTISDGEDTPILRWAGMPVSGPIIGNAGGFPILREQIDHQLVYNFSTVFGSGHSIKAGTDLRFSALDDRADNNHRGSWSFQTTCGGQTYATSWAAFFDGCVTSFSKGYGANYLENRLRDYNFYLEDNWRVSPNFTLNVGVRYEYVQAPEEIEDRIDYIYSDDKNNVQPRIGFAWTPTFESGFLGKLNGPPGSSSVRGGYGTYHGRIFQSAFSQTGAAIRSNPPNAASLTFTNSLNISDPTNGFVFTPGTPTTRISIWIPDDDLEMPMTHQWNLTVERQMFWDSALRLSYTGTYSNSMLKYLQDNLPLSPLDGPVTVVDHPFNAPAAGFPDLRGKQITAIAANVQCAGTGFFPGVTVNATCPVPVPLADNEISLRVPRTNERRPDPRYTTNFLVSNAAYSWYNGLQAEWNKRMSQGLQFTVNYTWSKAMDTTSEATFVGTGDSNQNGPNKDYSKGYSRFHTPHRFTLMGSYRLPWWQDRADLAGLLLGGWQLSGIVRLASGTPFTVINTGVDLNFDGFSESRPVLLDPAVLFNSVDHPSTSRDQLPAAAFRALTITDGVEAELVGRNTFFVDGTNRVDLSIQKNVRMPYGHSLNIRIDAFNAFNQVQFGWPGNNISTPATFGLLNTTANAYAARVVQLALRYRF
ncbi:MAG: TonB-dependent receptor [Vicinamibacterales bacterium]|nr:TonB-dependent receptor [Vicinamibacterales bacterium]